jgi:hypothetical protein
MISASTVSTITLTYSGDNPWTVFDSSNLATGHALQVNWNDLASQLNAIYRPLLNSAVDELGILSGVSGADYIGISGITGVSTGSSVYSAIRSLNTAVSAINASAAYAGSAAYAVSATTAHAALFAASATTAQGALSATTAARATTANAASYAASAGTLSGYSSIMTTTGSQVMTNYLKAANLSSYSAAYIRNAYLSTTSATGGASGNIWFEYTV